MKKTIAVLLVFALSAGNFSPCAFAIQDVKIKNREVKTVEDKRQYVNLSWWEGFGDEFLNEYIERALSNNHDLKTTVLKTEQSRQNVKMQFANELPSLSVGAAPAVVKVPGGSSSAGMFGIPIIASYELDIFLKNHDKTKSVKKLYETSLYAEKAAYIAVVSQVGACYFNILKADKLIEIQKQIISERKQIFELMKQSNEAGIVSTSDAVKAEKAYILAESEITDLQKSRDVLLRTLGVLIGENPENSLVLPRKSIDDLTLSKNIPSSISSDIPENRPDFLIAEKMLEKAGIDVRIAKKEFLPTVDILGLLAFSTSSFMKTMNWETALGAAGASVMLPLFTGGRKVANLKINKNRYEQAVQNYLQTELTAIKEVNDALCALKYDDEKFKKNTAALNSEKKDFEYSRQKYEAGLISKLDLLQKKETLHVTEKLTVASKTDGFINQISLYKAVGAADVPEKVSLK